MEIEPGVIVLFLASEDFSLPRFGYVFGKHEDGDYLVSFPRWIGAFNEKFLLPLVLVLQEERPKKPTESKNVEMLLNKHDKAIKDAMVRRLTELL